MTNESITIPKKKKGSSDEFSFENLYRQGLEYAQQLSGKIWTDYNLHDPGVTILEQLCFALTDMLYRTEYSVPDLLTSPDGQLDYAALSLHAPKEIFPSRPVTADDYRRILFSEILEIDNVWVEPLAGAESPFCGLYRILAAPSRPHLSKKTEQRLQEAVTDLYAKHRNLCEDVEEIVLLKPVPCHLKATVCLDGSAAPEEVLAAIYHHCGRETAARPKVISYADLAQKERPEELFNGPLTGGKISELRQASRLPPSLARIFSLLNETPGVERIDSFRFSEDKTALKKILAEGRMPCYCLTVPENSEEVRTAIKLTKNNREINWSWTRFHTRLEELAFGERTLRQQSSQVNGLHPLPTGTYRNPGQYSSIQNVFPALYGINANGVPESYPAEAKAAAAQLKAYLLPFEQILADYLAQLENLPRLFSVEQELRQSYCRQQLDKSKVPGIDKVLCQNSETFFKKLHRRFDNYQDRKKRVLDYLLALHGERFTGKSLRSLNTHLRPDEFEDHMLTCKARLLKHVVQVNRHRSAAVNYQETVWGNPDNISGLQRKTALLLGWEEGRCNCSLIEVFSKAGFSIFDDCCAAGGGDAAATTEDESEPVPPMQLADESLAGLREKARPLLPKDGSMPTSLLRNGVRLKAYGLAARDSDKAVRVRFRPAGAPSRWLPGLFADKELAALAVNALHSLLHRLNQASEGMHVVEHILLRPAVAWKVEEENFYSNRISVVLPNWTASCSNRQFQLLVEETVRLNCPAHVMPTFYWLDAVRMAEFESLHRSSLARRHCKGCGEKKQHNASRALVNFMRRHQMQQEEKIW
jgi:hypothetical protein